MASSFFTPIGILPSGAQVSGDPDDPRTVADVTGFEQHEHVDNTWRALVDWNQHTPSIFLRGDVLTRVSTDEGASKLATFSVASLKEHLSKAVVFAKWEQVPDPRAPDDPNTPQMWRWDRVPCPGYIPAFILARTPGQLEGAARINRVVEVPVFGALDADGHATFLGAPGYDPFARVYYEPAQGILDYAYIGSKWGSSFNDGIDTVREPNVAYAKRIILDQLLADFPFTDDASKAHAVALLLEPFVREAIGDEPTPMYAVLAHNTGQGKGYLTQACLGISCGPRLPTMTFSGGEGFESAENRKKLTAKLITAPSVIYFDNVKAKLDSDALEAALTSTRWEDRILGGSRMADVPIRNVWVFTANNPSIGRDMSRRIVPIFLDHGDGVNPRERTDWKVDLPTWANEHRSELVEAALVLARNYFEGTGYAYDEDDIYTIRVSTRDVLATYPSWSRIMGGILKAADIPGFLGNLDSLASETAVESDEAADFLADWFARAPGFEYAQTLKGVTTILGSITGPDGHVWPVAELPLDLRVHRDQFEAKLGYWLRKNRDSVNGGYRVKKTDTRPAKWYVEKIGA
jgi:hypothetical protein